MTEIHLVDRDGHMVTRAYITPTGGKGLDVWPELVVWQNRHYVRWGGVYRETFAWPAFTTEDLEWARDTGLLT